ncbi:transmembrane protein 127-like [Hetaerina americana]|uniref:transmembrane protein 127-like n=1 Tax=Hetaerina americana TaxID=62018 RepID=UPI003A7F439B
MYNPSYYPRQRWHILKDQDRNFAAAFFHMATIALTCTSLAQLGWFRLTGGKCVPHLAVYQFFSFGYFDTSTTQSDLSFRSSEVSSSPITVQYHSPSGTLPCVTPEIANLMRILIVMCFLAMASSLFGFFLDIIGPTKKSLQFIQRNSLPSIVTVLWVVGIIGVCYYITILIESSLQSQYPNSNVFVTYEYGCYTITAAGAASNVATACNLLRPHPPQSEEVILQHRRLVDDWDEAETFSVAGPQRLFDGDTPLESIPPPPPYTP